MSDVGRWLRAIGLERYLPIFLENGVDQNALRSFTDQDLQRLGIPTDHRKLILASMLELKQRHSHENGKRRSRTTVAVDSQTRDAERRVLTILFVDMVKSTSFAQRLDPEDLANLMNEFHDICSKVVCRFGGYVAKNLGDGLGAYFGWPESHEHDAERAVLTGLELIEAVKSIYTGDLGKIHVHVGVATGEVVVGDVPRMDSARVQEVFGELPSLAARLQAACPPDAILASAATFELIRAKFVCAKIGRKKLRGFHEYTDVYQVIGPRTYSLNFDARSATGLTPLIGRAAELQLMKNLWRQVTDGKGQLVQLVGEPGIGKSRLCAELRSLLDEQSFVNLSFQCSVLHKNSPLYPVMRPIGRLAALSDDDSPEMKLRKLEELFGSGSQGDRGGIVLLAAHMGVSAGAGDSQSILSSESPERKQMILFRLLSNRVALLAREQPVLVIFEDIHWMDPTTSKFLEVLLTYIPEHRIMLIFTFRPEFPSFSHPHEFSTLLTLDRLNRSQATQFISAVSAAEQLSPELISEIVERSDGNPLYIEELTAAVLNKRKLRKEPNHVDITTKNRAKIPSTLQESLFARIDQTSAQARDLIQLCAVIGRRFSYEQLLAVADVSARDLDDALNELVRSRVLYRAGRRPRLEFSFKHALIQDAAYAMILKAKRRRLHEKCAIALETRLAAVCEHDPGMLALHHELAGNSKAAVPYLFAAGQLALEQSALKEATNYLQRGLDLLNTWPDSDLRKKEELQFRALLGRACIFAKGWAHPSVKNEYEIALGLSKQLRNNREQVNLEWALTTYHLLRGEVRDAAIGGERVLGLAEQVNDPDLKHVAHSALTIYKFYAGEFSNAIRHKEEALRFYRAEAREDLQRKFGTDRRLQALRGAALAHWCLGNHQTALDLDEKQRSAAINGGHLFDHAYAMTISCILHSLRRDARKTYAYAKAAIDIAQAHGFSFLEANANNFQAIARALKDPCEGTLRDCDTVIEKYQISGNRMGISAMWSIMGELCGQVGLFERGHRYVDKAVEYSRRSGERFAQADLYRIRAELLSGTGKMHEAELCLQRALTVARQQHARTWELGAAVRLAQLLAARGQVEKATKLLQPLYNSLSMSEFEPDRLALVESVLGNLIEGKVGTPIGVNT
jgi:predicted ATPase/class 3 adenylate cyclase